MRGGARPGAGRPKGSKNRAPRETGPETERIWLRLHPHVLAALKREAEELKIKPNRLAVHVIDMAQRCPCDECRARRRECLRLIAEHIARKVPHG